MASHRQEREAQGEGWDIGAALSDLRSRIDPYLWDQGQELFRRGAVEDFQITESGSIRVEVLDPREHRKFFVGIERERSGRVRAVCPCPCRIGGYCRHQVVALEYLRSIRGTEAATASRGGASPTAEDARRENAGVAPLGDAHSPAGSILYRLDGPSGKVTASADGSLLRAVLHGLGSLASPHRVGLQLFTGTGWTELRGGEASRWADRGGGVGVHPRDAALLTLLCPEGLPLAEIDSNRFAALLALLAGSEALVSRSGVVQQISLWPLRLAARLVRGEGERDDEAEANGEAEIEDHEASGHVRCERRRAAGLGVELACVQPDGRRLPFDEVSLIPASSPWVQLVSGEFHPLIAGASGAALEELQAEDLSEIAPAELDRFLTDGVAALERLCLDEVEIEPGLIEQVEGVDGARLKLEGDADRLWGRLELRYGEEWIAAPSSPEPWTATRLGVIHRYPAAGQSLSRARRELEALGFLRREDEEGSVWALEEPGALATVLAPRPGAFVELILPAELLPLDLTRRPLRVCLEVALAESLPVELEASAVSAAGRDGEPGARGTGIDWLELTFTLREGERELPLDLELLRDALADDPARPLQLADGNVIAPDNEALRLLVGMAQEDLLDESEPRHLRLPLAAVGELVEPPAGVEVAYDPRAARLVEALRAQSMPEAGELLAEIDRVLRPYQKAAVRWMGGLATFGLAGILADEMGLGKTVMALAHFFGRGAAPAGAAPVLVVCPSSLVFNWLDECHRFFPAVRAVGLQGRTRPEREELLRGEAEIYITSYALLRRDRELFAARPLRAVVLDEGQHIKNPESQTAQAACELDAAERWILTGTPVENRLGDLWSLFEFLMPGFLGERADLELAAAPPDGNEDAEAPLSLSALRRRLRPFMLRRTKAQVLADLPPRIDQLERVGMGEAQERLYRAVLERSRVEAESARDGGPGRLQILTALTRLRQVCCHPRLVREEAERWGLHELARSAAEEAGGKFELCLELLSECFEEGHRVLLYSQFTSVLDLFEARLDSEGVRRCRLDGSTRDREGEVRRFQASSEIPVFLISLRAGGFGLNLTQADTVILYDPWWNPAVEEQAAARAHRLGQTLPVHVHKLITAGTVEEKMLELQARKLGLAGRVVGSEEEAMAALTIEDLRGVLMGS